MLIHRRDLGRVLVRHLDLSAAARVRVGRVRWAHPSPFSLYLACALRVTPGPVRTELRETARSRSVHAARRATRVPHRHANLGGYATRISAATPSSESDLPISSRYAGF